MLQKLLSLDPAIVAAIVAALTSICTLFVSLMLKSLIERNFHVFRLQQEHDYLQKKQIKDTLSKHKGPLLKDLDSLFSRLKNLTKNHGSNGHCVEGNFADMERYYFQSFVYRILAVFARIRIIENELIHLDATIADKNDLVFMKYLTILPLSFQDGDLMRKNGLSDKEIRKDLIYRDTFHESYEWLIKGDNVLTFTQFKSKATKNLDNYKEVCEFLDGISPTEKRFRWDRLYILQMLIVSFLNRFGYDFQKSNEPYIRKLIKRQGKTSAYKNLEKHMFQKYELQDEPEIKEIVKILASYK